MAKALKPFKSRLHRFAAGAEVPEGADLSPHNAADLVDRGFLEGAPPPAAPGRSRAADPVESAAETASE